jgi:hypothetical protein
MRQRPRRPRRAIGGLLGRLVVIVAVLAAAAGIAVPSLRTSIRKKFLPHFTPIAVVGATTSGRGACDDAQLGSDNSTIYWFTHPVGRVDQILTVRLGPAFKGNLAKVGLTPELPQDQTPGSQALPFPSQLQVLGRPGGPPSVLSLAVPPKFQSLAVKATRPQFIQIKLLANDPTPAAGQCVQTALVLYQKD